MMSLQDCSERQSNIPRPSSAWTALWAWPVSSWSCPCSERPERGTLPTAAPHCWLSRRLVSWVWALVVRLPRWPRCRPRGPNPTPPLMPMVLRRRNRTRRNPGGPTPTPPLETGSWSGKQPHATVSIQVEKLDMHTTFIRR